MMTTHLPERTETRWDDILAILQYAKSSNGGPRNGEAETGDSLLEKRAKEYARCVVDDDGRTTDEIETLTVDLGTDTYAIPCSSIEQIRPLGNLVPLPLARNGIIGISSNRGVVYAVLDPKLPLRIPGKNLTTMHRIVFLRHPEYRIGMLVDAVHGMTSMRLSDMQPVPDHMASGKNRYIRGLAPNRVFLMDIDGMLTDPTITGESV